MRSLTDIRAMVHQECNKYDVLNFSIPDLERLDRSHITTPESRIAVMKSLPDLLLEAVKRARNWLIQVITFHAQTWGRSEEVRLFRSAIEKEMEGKKGAWSELEGLYMVLTDDQMFSEPRQRLEAAFTMIFEGDYAEKYKPILDRAQQLKDHLVAIGTTATPLDRHTLDTQIRILRKAQTAKIDRFACSVPLTTIKQSADEEDRACAICQNSFTDVASFSIDDLLSDYPIRIKYCGHVVGKSCLETWLQTPIIDSAKYPFRTCPMCRVKITNTKKPGVPDDISHHLRYDRRALETRRATGLKFKEACNAVLRCMSEEVAVEGLLEEASNVPKKDGDICSQAQMMLVVRKEELNEEKRAWGFRGDILWKKLRGQWIGVEVGGKSMR